MLAVQLAFHITVRDIRIVQSIMIRPFSNISIYCSTWNVYILQRSVKPIHRWSSTGWENIWTAIKQRSAVSFVEGLELTKLAPSGWFSGFTEEWVCYTNKRYLLRWLALRSIPCSHTHTLVDVGDGHVVSDIPGFRLLIHFLIQDFFVTKILVVNVRHVHAREISDICLDVTVLVWAVFSRASLVFEIIVITGRFYSISIRFW